MFICLLDDELSTAISLNSLDNPIFSTASDALHGICLPPMKSALSDWRIDNGVLFYKDRVYMPAAQHSDILTKHHDHPTAGHPGQFKTEELIKHDVKIQL